MRLKQSRGSEEQQRSSRIAAGLKLEGRRRHATLSPAQDSQLACLAAASRVRRQAPHGAAHRIASGRARRCWPHGRGLWVDNNGTTPGRQGKTQGAQGLVDKMQSGARIEDRRIASEIAQRQTPHTPQGQAAGSASEGKWIIRVNAGRRIHYDLPIQTSGRGVTRAPSIWRMSGQSRGEPRWTLPERRSEGPGHAGQIRLQL